MGIGVGPANLALASLLDSHPEASNLFIDKKQAFGWHDGQLVPGAALQVSMIKDLVSLVDPTNKFSFLAYLVDQGRIYHFLNAQFEAVPRREFRNYLDWACRKNGNIVFGEEALSVSFDRVFVVETTRRTITADNIAVGVGTQPWVPPHVAALLGRTQFHVSDFAELANGLSGKHVCVAGGGQSGAEAFLDLISRTSAERPAHISWVSHRSNFLPLDDSPFTNEFYMPSYSEYFFGLAHSARKELNERHVLTSDGISESLLRQIYQTAYEMRFLDGVGDLFTFLPDREIAGVAGSEETGWTITLTHNKSLDEQEEISADTIIWATGFRPSPMDFLEPVAGRLERAGKEFRLDEDFAVVWNGPPDHSIFIQNGARQQRGHADANLSLNAWRSQRIVNRLLGSKTAEQLGSFLSWSRESGS